MLSYTYRMCYLKRQSQLQLILQTQSGNGSRYWSEMKPTSRLGFQKLINLDIKRENVT
ncbi:hypothetical protein Gotur_004529 [Gossypium turneri]